MLISTVAHNCHAKRINFTPKEKKQLDLNTFTCAKNLVLDTDQYKLISHCVDDRYKQNMVYKNIEAKI